MRKAAELATILTVSLGSCVSPGCLPEGASPPHSLLGDLEAVRSTYSPAALAYLEAAIDTLQQHHIAGSEHDWEELRLATLEKSATAKSVSDTYDAIRFALQDLDDRHGQFLPTDATPPDDPPDDGINRSCAEQGLPSLVVRDAIAHLRMPSLLDTSRVAAACYASRADSLVRLAESAGVCGWIVDLRGNGGGNMWPMLAGLGPLLGSGEIGSFRYRGGVAARWSLDEGEIALDGKVMHEVLRPHTASRTTPPVAVVADSGTGSSGEAVLVAFRGRDDVRTFGKPTGGASTVPGYFRLQDGAWLVFSTGRMADRRGEIYGGPIEPDRDTNSPVEDALEWLAQLDGCVLQVRLDSLQ